MRTTVTLDDDVAAALERIRTGRDASFKQIVNEVLRAGLKQMANRPRRCARHTTRVVDPGRSRLGGLHHVAEIMQGAEGEAFK